MQVRFRNPTPEHQSFRETLRAFVDREIRPRAREFDAAGQFDRSLYSKMGELGFLGLRYSEEFGGSDLDWSYTEILAEEMGRCDNMGVCTGILVHTDMATPSLARFGSKELKGQFLGPAIRGEMIAAVAVTEPDAGSDVSGVRTRAVRDGDEWLIHGAKLYITNAATADWMCVLAVTDPEAGHRGFSQIIVPTSTPGVKVDLLDKIGFWGSDTGAVFFEEVRVPVTNTIGDIGRGFQQQMMQFQDERLVVTISLVAYGDDLLRETLEWTRNRKLFGRRLIDMQNTQFRLVESRAELEACRQLNRSCVDALLRGEDATELISMAKLFVCRAVRNVADRCFQLHGGMAYMKESMAGRAFVDTRIASIGGGSDETMMHYLARRFGFDEP